MNSIASGGGFEIVQDGDRVLFLDRNTWGIGVTAIVSAVGGAFFFVAAIVFGLIIEEELRVAIAAVMATLALLEAIVAFVCGKIWQRRRDRPASELTPLLVADLAAGELQKADGTRLAGLDEVELEKITSPTSSARELQLRWPNGRNSIFRGNISGAGLDEPAAALQQLGVGGKQEG